MPLFAKLSVLSISIHAPSRERHSCAYVARYIMKFQSTLPRGSDHSSLGSCLVRVDFNPRSLAGATVATRANSVALRLFQSTLPRGSDRVRSQFGRTQTSFQSTLPRGSDALNIILANILQNFNPRSLAGAT